MRDGAAGCRLNNAARRRSAGFNAAAASAADEAIAQAFGVNQGRICEILKGQRHSGSREAALGKHAG